MCPELFIYSLFSDSIILCNHLWPEKLLESSNRRSDDILNTFYLSKRNLIWKYMIIETINQSSLD